MQKGGLGAGTLASSRSFLNRDAVSKRERARGRQGIALARSLIRRLTPAPTLTEVRRSEGWGTGYPDEPPQVRTLLTWKARPRAICVLAGWGRVETSSHRWRTQP